MCAILMFSLSNYRLYISCLRSNRRDQLKMKYFYNVPSGLACCCCCCETEGLLVLFTFQSEKCIAFPCNLLFSPFRVKWNGRNVKCFPFYALWSWSCGGARGAIRCFQPRHSHITLAMLTGARITVITKCQLI